MLKLISIGKLVRGFHKYHGSFSALVAVIVGCATWYQARITSDQLQLTQRSVELDMRPYVSLRIDLGNPSEQGFARYPEHGDFVYMNVEFVFKNFGRSPASGIAFPKPDIQSDRQIGDLAAPLVDFQRKILGGSEIISFLAPSEEGIIDSIKVPVHESAKYLYCSAVVSYEGLHPGKGKYWVFVRKIWGLTFIHDDQGRPRFIAEEIDSVVLWDRNERGADGKLVPPPPPDEPDFERYERIKLEPIHIPSSMEEVLRSE